MLRQHVPLLLTVRSLLTVNVSSHCTTLYGLTCYKPPSRWRLPAAKSTFSYVVLILVHRPGVRGHLMSRPLPTSCGGTWRTDKVYGQKSSAGVSWLYSWGLQNCQRAKKFSLRCKQLCLQTVVSAKQWGTFWTIISLTYLKTDVLWYCLVKTDVFFSVL
jgi:hypothetical protein